MFINTVLVCPTSFISLELKGEKIAAWSVVVSSTVTKSQTLWLYFTDPWVSSDPTLITLDIHYTNPQQHTAHQQYCNFQPYTTTKTS